MIVAGTVTYKMAEVIRRIYEQMGDPKWVVAMGACASSGGMYRSYAIPQGWIELFLSMFTSVAVHPDRKHS